MTIILRMQDLATSEFKRVTGVIGDLTKKVFSLKGAVAGYIGAMSTKTVIETAGKLDSVGQAFETLTSGIGGSATVLETMQKASMGAVNKLDLMTAAVKALGPGVVRTRGELEKMVKIAFTISQARGIDPTEAILSLANAFGRREMGEALQLLGIVIDSEKLIADYADRVGMAKDKIDGFTKRQLMLNAALASGDEQLSRLGPTLTTVKVQWEQLKAALADLGLDVLKAILPGLSAGIVSFADVLEANRGDILFGLANIVEALGLVASTATWMASWLMAIWEPVPRFFSRLRGAWIELELLWIRYKKLTTFSQDAQNGLTSQEIALERMLKLLNEFRDATSSSVPALEKSAAAILKGTSESAEGLMRMAIAAKGAAHTVRESIDDLGESCEQIITDADVARLEASHFADRREKRIVIVAEAMQQYRRDLARLDKEDIERQEEAEKARVDRIRYARQLAKDKFDDLKAQREASAQQDKEILDAAWEYARQKTEYAERYTVKGGLGKIFKEMALEAKSFGEMASDSIRGVSDALTSDLSGAINDVIFQTKDAKTAFIEMGQSFMREVADILLKSTLKWAVNAAVSSISSYGFAKGGIVPGPTVPFAGFYGSGGYVSRPSLLVAGEGSTSEAIVPLPDNKNIPVRFVGGSGERSQVVNNYVTVNYSAPTTSEEKRMIARNSRMIADQVVRQMNSSLSVREGLR
jgi:hypothetical protein